MILFIAKILIFSNIREYLAEIAQLVEHSPEERRVPSANLGLGTKTEQIKNTNINNWYFLFS